MIKGIYIATNNLEIISDNGLVKFEKFRTYKIMFPYKHYQTSRVTDIDDNYMCWISIDKIEQNFKLFLKL